MRRCHSILAFRLPQSRIPTIGSLKTHSHAIPPPNPHFRLSHPRPTCKANANPFDNPTQKQSNRAQSWQPPPQRNGDNMKRIPILTAALLAAATFAAQAAPAGSESDIDSKQEVAYTCQILQDNKLQNIKLTAMYGIKNNQPIVAQVRINGVTTPGMWRDTSFNLLNRFISNDPAARTTVWTTMPADASKLTQVDGGKLSVAEKAGAQQSVIADNCRLDKAATAKLNK